MQSFNIYGNSMLTLCILCCGIKAKYEKSECEKDLMGNLPPPQLLLHIPHPPTH